MSQQNPRDIFGQFLPGIPEKRCTSRRGGLRQEVLLALGCVVIGVFLGALAVLSYRNHLRNPRSSVRPERFVYSLENFVTVPPERIGFEPVWQVEIPGTELRSVTVSGETAWIALDEGILPVALSAEKGQIGEMIALPAAPRCLAVASEKSGGETTERFYVGSGSRILVVDRSGTLLREWDFFGSKANITSIVVADSEIFAADAGNRVVHRLDLQGEKIGEIGHRDAQRGIPGFIIPSPYFDLAWGEDGLLRVVNPGMRRIEIYTPEGDLQIFWGKAGLDEAGFCGCCNPSHIALFSDGRVVTAEKGIPRVKVYLPQGDFVTWVASPDHFAPQAKLEETRDQERLPVLDVAVFRAAGNQEQQDKQEEWVLVLDPGRRVLEAFRPKKT